MAATPPYLKPGDYIGFAIKPAVATITGFPRIPCFVGKGSRLAQNLDTAITRAYVPEEELTFTGTGPYTAVLAYQSDGNKANTRIVDQDGVELDGSKYEFATAVVANDSIVISSVNYDTTATYTIEYQSVDREVLDAVPFEDLRSVIRCGKGPGGTAFTEFVDFLVAVDVTDGVADAGNNAATGTSKTYGSSNSAVCTISGPSAENITATAATAGVGGNGVKVVTVAGGSLSVTENTGTRVVTIQYVSSTSTTTAIVAASSALTLVTLTGAGVTTWGAGQDAQEEWTTSMTRAVRAGAGDVYFATTSAYTHAYNRTYVVECVTGGASGTARFAWYSTPTALGNDIANHNPTHVTYATTAGVRNEIGSGLSDGSEVTLEYGIKIAIQDEGGSFNVGDQWTFTAYGVATVERSPLHENTNQFTTISSVTATETGTGVVTVSSSTGDYTGVWNRAYKLTVVAITSTTDVTFAWTAVGDDGIATGTTSALADGGTATLDRGVEITVDLGATNFVVGDKFTFTVSAPRVVPDVKDDRSYSAEVSAASAGSVSFIYSSGTQEGGTGTFTATTADQSITFIGNLTMMVRNVATPRFTVGDIFTWTTTLSDTIDWSLLTEVTEVVASSSVITDTLGRITGTAGNFYVVLRKAPTSITEVLFGSSAGSGTIVTDVNGQNTRYVDLGASSPGAAVTVTYRHRGSEPTPGTTYRFSAYYLRGADLYNTPTLVTSRDVGETLLFPMGTSNHLAIVNDIAWKLNPLGFYVCQVADADDDGIFQDSDYDTAIEATEGTTRITDLVVLSAFGTLGTQLAQINELSDSLRKAFRMVWIGCPTDTEIGDATTTDSLVYTATNTCAVFGDAPYHGTRVMVGATEATYTITLANGKTASVSLDGSFVAAALCLQYASFAEPWMTVLRQTISVFDFVQTYTEAENAQLGAAQINYLTEVGTGIYRWEEDMTTDPVGTAYNADEFRQINAMVQKQYVRQVVSAAIDAAVISLTPEDPAAGVEAIRNTVKGALEGLVASKKIGQYVDSSGRVRALNSATDIIVYRSRTRATTYYYHFAFFIRNTIKQTFGTALVDSNDFGITEQSA